MESKNIQEIFADESAHIDKLHQIVQQSIEEEKLVIDNLLNPPKEIISKGQKISDKVAQFGGSWKFIILFAFVLIFWILSNVLLPKGAIFDPYPFILMNLILSTVAAFQAPVILMSQNRQEEKDRIRSENDYVINLKAEMQIRSLHQKMDLLLEEQIKTLYESQARQFDMLEEINRKLGQPGPERTTPTQSQ